MLIVAIPILINWGADHEAAVHGGWVGLVAVGIEQSVS